MIYTKVSNNDLQDRLNGIEFKTVTQTKDSLIVGHPEEVGLRLLNFKTLRFSLLIYFEEIKD